MLKSKTKKTDAPKLHSLSSLITLVNKKYKYSPSDTLEIVQSLYDAPLKLVTYPRTDSHNITENEFEYLKKQFTRISTSTRNRVYTLYYRSSKALR